MAYRVITSLVLLTLATGLSGCGKNSGPRIVSRTMNLTLTNFDDLGANHVYEAWLATGNDLQSVGRFSPVGGSTDPAIFTIDEDSYQDADALVISIEPANGDLPSPTLQRLVAGPLNDGTTTAALRVSDVRALGDPFSGVGAQYILETPTSAPTEDYSQGLYWCVPGDFLGIPEPVVPEDPNLDTTMPSVPTGWTYEGWTVVEGEPISTGRFNTALAPDSDGLGPAAGPLPGMPFPGQEHIDPPLSLIGAEVMLTVEPEPDYSPEPFPLTVLYDEYVDDMGLRGMQWTGNRAVETAPQAMATFTPVYETATTH